MMEYVEYKPENNKPVTIKQTVNNEIDDALNIMHSAQCNNQEPVNDLVVEPTVEPVVDHKEESQEPVNLSPEQQPVNVDSEPQEPVNDPIKGYVNFRHSSTFFKRIFKTLGTICNEAKIFFTSENIKTCIVDPAHVVMITVEIPITTLTEYKITQDINLGFDLDKLEYILKGSGKDDLFEFLFDSDKNQFKAFIKNGLFEHTYTLIDTAGLPEPKIPTLDLPVTIKLNTKILHDFLMQAEKISDHVIITATKNNLTFNAEGDSDKVNITIDKNLLSFYECGSTYTSLFSIDYLLSIVKQLKPVFDEITLNMGSDNPLRITGDNGYKVDVLLAPRIESE